ncbi:enoyl-CoA hydratase/isomerase family protein [Spiractinospora alimapuensis]|uniref:enoyl-CoA hydratase-related protein n=1 Tax=Spiractinospora alimapuensis TaxID=2820884 RepID=UPI001F47B775|nr:enoyl-CoA hydratase-related protein [Spiractinospora alimapuensis]QVQ54053.1 enoyl-CoA hydratase/isomerase family protein [Spiractinospora alimapuensis]
MSSNVLYEVNDSVATVTLNRPDSLNSLTVEMKEELLDALRRAGEEARAIVLTGAGRAFCVGQDLHEHADNLAQGKGLDDTVRRHYNQIVLALREVPAPVIAAVNGVAAGAGAAFSFACDLRVASENAKFSMAFTQIGLTADSGASWTLPRLVGLGRATELLMLAEPVSAEYALQIGLVNRVVSADDLMGDATEIATRLANGPTTAYGAVKGALAYSSVLKLDQALELEARLQEECAETKDHVAATRAFLDKETPTFTGR